MRRFIVYECMHCDYVKNKPTRINVRIVLILNHSLYELHNINAHDYCRQIRLMKYNSFNTPQVLCMFKASKEH